ncbi:hypothetical protein BC830DRAFT_1157901 [Chytriomyces sp. MP71]|nr:hypothetical protein BC830DRAFT_1157901 [Chytriomyces sp. MP71]
MRRSSTCSQRSALSSRPSPRWRQTIWPSAQGSCPQSGSTTPPPPPPRTTLSLPCPSRTCVYCPYLLCYHYHCSVPVLSPPPPQTNTGLPGRRRNGRPHMEGCVLASLLSRECECGHGKRLTVWLSAGRTDAQPMVIPDATKLSWRIYSDPAEYADLKKKLF